MTELALVLRQRWSPKFFDPEQVVTDDQVRLLLEAARWAPSARNEQPWRFIIGRRGDAIRARIDPFVVGHSDWALSAGLFIVNIYRTWHPSLEVSPYDLGGAVAHMTVEAESMGLHFRQFATFDRPGLSAEFGVAAPFTAFTISAVGVTPAGLLPGERTRREPRELLWPTS